jgi:hypothetical protein
LSDAGNEIYAAAANDETTLKQLSQEQDALASQSHDGFADAVRLLHLQSEIKYITERIAQRKQRAVHGEE